MTNIHIVDPEPLSNEILVEKSLRPSFFDEFIGQKKTCGKSQTVY